jgi:sialate O-acetylesterase
MPMQRTWPVSLLFLLLAATAAAADVKLPAIFSDHMVLQQQMPLAVWGWATPGERVEVRLRAQRVSTTADREGRWRVTLAPETAGGPDELVVTGGTGKKRFTDVLIGEVWVGSGQSNMQWEVRQAQDADTEIAAANHPKIRLFSVKRVTSLEPKDDVTPMDDAPTWAAASPATIPRFSAVGYYFARALQQARDGVPIGFVHSSWGGTPAEAWTRRAVLEDDPALQPLLWQYRRFEGEYASLKYGYDKRQPVWSEAAKAWQAAHAGEPALTGMPAPRGAPDDPHRPASLWNAMIAPITPYAIRGVLWYQGETNALRAWDYQRLMTAMIQDWRRAWNRGDLPFLFVQLANFRPNPPTDGASWWAEVREAQRLTLGLPNTAMASAIDIGNPDDIHPLNKQEVGRRLALAARAVAYGERVVHAGPLYEGMTLEGAKIRVRFRHAGGGLILDASKGSGFTIAGTDGRFKPATAVVDGDTLVISSPEVAAPVSVRYAWQDDPVTTLRNKEGLPASPFRTDTF